MATTPEIAAFLKRLVDSFIAGQKPSAASMREWAISLSDLDPEILMPLAEQLKCTCRWFPSIAEIRECAVELTTPEQPSAIEAWQTVRAWAARWHGAIRPNDAALDAARAVGGLETIAMCDDAFEKRMLRQKFIEVYDLGLAREKIERQYLPSARRDQVKRLSAKIPSDMAEQEGGYEIVPEEDDQSEDTTRSGGHPSQLPGEGRGDDASPDDRGRD